MKLKKLCSVLLSGTLAFSVLAGVLPQKSSYNFLNLPAGITVEAASTMRRPCDSEHPMWIVHVETWNHADPEKIIALIPENLRPYVVFNISMSIYWTNHEWGMVQDGYELAKSWLKACADAGVWAMIQPSSGGQCHFPDYDVNGNIVNFPNKNKFTAHADDDYENTIYAEFFRDYPNFIGYNYCEQFWGFESEDFPIKTTQRYEHFAKLLKLCNKYGGYLDISWCANEWSPNINPIAMLKRVPSWEEACRKYSDNFILEEKYTQGSYIADVESEVFGAYISGYCGNFGVRYDETGWTDSTWSGTEPSSKDQFNQATSLPIYLERMVKNGATVIDGPELVTVDDFKELSQTTDSDGYRVRNWGTYDQFNNVPMDFMRKVVDGTICIPDRKEVIKNTKVAIIQDVSSGTVNQKFKDYASPNDALYSTYPSLFEGLYRMNGDGALRKNHNLYKSTGRYQTIPTVYALKDDLAKSIEVQVKQSQIESRWKDTAAKQAEFNKLYPADYYGNCYAGRNDNTWIAYNLNKDGSNCGAVLSLKYNTCKELDVNFNAYGSAIINEYSDHIDIYTNNYDRIKNNTYGTELRTDTFKISGCSAKPSYSAKDTGRNQTKSQISESYDNGTYTLTVKHNGPVEISVKCSGNQTGKLTSYNKSSVKAPAAPSFYTGTRQYEGELFDTKNIEGNVANACGSGVTGIQGQGFLKYGKNANAAVKDTVKTQKAGEFKLNLRYSITSDSNNVDLYVNGSKVKTLSLKKSSSYSDWKTVTETITLKQGENKIEFKANSELSSSLYIDCFTVEGNFGDSEVKPVEPINGKLIKNLVVSDTEHAENWSVQYDFNKNSQIFGDRSFTCIDLPSELIGAEYIRTACDSKTVTKDLGTFTAGDDITVYIAIDKRVVSIIPDWLKDWKKTGKTVTADNDLTFEIYKKSFESGENVTLGMNGGTGNNVNYIVLTKTTETVSENLAGDANLDGKVDIADVVAVASYVGNSDVNKLEPQGIINADVQGNGNGLNANDSLMIQQYLANIIENLSVSSSVATDPVSYMNLVRSNISEKESTDATEEKSNTSYGTFEKISYYSDVCKRNKNFNVLLPANYTESKKYPVLYVLHGYWGDENALLDQGDSSLKLRQIIGNAIAQGDAEEMIVVFPDIYASDTQDKCDGLNDKNNKAYDNFINVLTKEIMPYMEQNYSIKTGRDNTAITGFSMGGRESLYIGFSRPDLFGYVGAMCPAPGLTTDLLSDEQLRFSNIEPYMLFVSAGSNDTLIWSTPAGYHDAMTRNNTTHIWHYVDGGDHGGKTIRPHMYNFIRYIFKT